MSLAKSYWMLVLGVLLGVAFVVAVYAGSAHDYASSNGIDGEMFLGRWWDPTFTLLLGFIGYIGWTIGIGAGLLLRGVLDAMLDRSRANS